MIIYYIVIVIILISIHYVIPEKRSHRNVLKANISIIAKDNFLDCNQKAKRGNTNTSNDYHYYYRSQSCTLTCIAMCQMK